MKKFQTLVFSLFFMVSVGSLYPQSVMANSNPYGDEAMKKAETISFNQIYENTVSIESDRSTNDNQHYGEILYKFSTNSQTNYYKFSVSASDGITEFLVVNEYGAGISLGEESGDYFTNGTSYEYLDKNKTYYLVILYYYVSDEPPSYSFKIETTVDNPDDFQEAPKGSFNKIYSESFLKKYDYDWYKFTAKEFCDVTLTIYKKNKPYVEWEIYNKEKEILASCSDYPTSSFQLLPNETIYIKFSKKNTNKNISYSFKLKCTPAKYIKEGPTINEALREKDYIWFSWNEPKNFTLTKRNASGYQIRYSAKKNMKNPILAVDNKNASLWPDVGTGVIFPKNLTKPYFFQVRSYLKIGNKKYYSKWSSPVQNRQ